MKIMSFFKRQNSVVLTTIFGLIVIGILICLPTGKVVGTDNSAIITSGLIQSGEQLCTLEIGNGIFAGQTLEGVNFLSGSLEKDKIFKTGDRALLTISYKGQEIKSVILSDHYRLDKEFILLAVFAVFLVVFAGKIGFQAILSFFITILMIWLFPGLDRHRHHGCPHCHYHLFCIRPGQTYPVRSPGRASRRSYHLHTGNPVYGSV